MVQDEKNPKVQAAEENQPVEPEGNEPETKETAERQPESQTKAAEPQSDPQPAEQAAAGADPQEPSEAARFKPGQTLKLDELEEEKEYDPNEIKKFEQIYEATLNQYTEGQVVKGKIISIDAREVSVDIGFKTEGIVPIEEFSNVDDLKIGDEIEVYIDTLEDKDGQLILSKRKADFLRAWDRVIEKAERGEIMKGRIVRRIKGGMVVDLEGVEAFLPGSQIDVRPIRDFDALIGQVYDFKVVNINHARKNIVVSRRVLVEEEMKDQREKILRELHKGQVLEGIVKNITDFGVFIDLGGVDGLLHINDLSWGRINHPSEIVSLDQKIKVMVLDFDENKTRISLGYKQLQPHPWEGVEEKYPVGSKVTGKVVNITDYGAFVELEKGVEGLIHISEMSWTQHIRHPSEVVSLGDIVEAVVLNVNKDEHKISLGLKQLTPDPWEKIEEKYPIGSRHKGIVRNLTNFGAFVELEEGIDGLIHISDLSWTKKIRHPSEVLQKDQEIEVEVLAIDRENRRISLGYKQLFENPWEKLAEEYKVGTQVKGKITRCMEKGLVVEIPDEVEGFVPLSHLVRLDRPGPKRTTDHYRVGEELDLTVIEFDKENKRIVLSEKGLVEEPLKHDESKKGEEKEEDKAKAARARRPRKKEAKEKAAEKEKEKVAEEKSEEAKKEGEAKAEKPAEKSPAPEEKAEPGEAPAEKEEPDSGQTEQDTSSEKPADKEQSPSEEKKEE
jgi:small subunit ribosomal protein S1